jgi:putative ABC transport system substrate-binding protein
VAASVVELLKPVNLRDADEIERDIEAFAQFPTGGVIVTAGSAAGLHRYLIVKLADRHNLPTISFDRAIVTAGGLISYGVDYIDQYRKAAGYVDRILKGEKPADPIMRVPKLLRVGAWTVARLFRPTLAGDAARRRSSKR